MKARVLARLNSMKYPSNDKRELWQAAIEFYQALVEEDNWHHQKPMLELVQWLAASEYSAAFYPSTSHHSLCISPGVYPERYEMPMISVLYSKLQSGFILKYADGHNRASFDEHCRQEQIKTALPALLLRLEMETTT